VSPRRAAVLILLYPCPEGLCFLLTRRTAQVATHKGQISLPGGAQEDEEDLGATALREASEELGLPLTDVEILGDLTPLYIPVSGFEVTPIIAAAPGPLSIHAQSAEVEEVISVPLALLLENTVVYEEEWDLNGVRAVVPFYRIQGYAVWGATAMILAELAALLARVVSP
jgi:8-oxo-dGTP pyrophosphatase MutT (NUDIX family)